MKNKVIIDKTLALIVISALPFLIDQACQIFSDNLYCETMKPYIEYQEPYKADYQVSILFSPVSTVTASGTSTYYNSATTT